MTVTKPRRTKVYELETWGRGAEAAASEFHAPRRDAGTKMLKVGGELWMYMPAIEKVQKISGHMLRQGMMGSDVSYEDLLEFSEWQEMYTAALQGEESCGESTCWKLKLTAKSEDIAYPVRDVWVDQATRIPVRQELFAVSGMLLKTWIMEAPQAFGERWYPTRMILEDKLQDTRRENWQWVGYSFFAMVVFTVALSLLAHLALSAISILMVSAQFTLVPRSVFYFSSFVLDFLGGLLGPFKGLIGN